jgi:hypothetical protein
MAMNLPCADAFMAIFGFRRVSAEEQRVKFGWPQVSDEQRAENLDANLDEFCGQLSLEDRVSE